MNSKGMCIQPFYGSFGCKKNQFIALCSSLLRLSDVLFHYSEKENPQSHVHKFKLCSN